MSSDDNEYSDSGAGGTDEPLISVRCYVKMLMHALRYPHATVNGLLVADRKKKGKSIRLVDYIPMFHSGHGLTPMVEVALTQISEYLSKSPGNIIGGYYQANEHFHELPQPIPTLFAERIAEKLYESNPDTVLFMLSNFHLATAIDDSDNLNQPFFMFHFIDGRWKLKGTAATGYRGFQLEDSSLTFDAVQELIFKKQYHLNLVDFDSHLDNVKQDWRNLVLNDIIDNFN